jgi:membrane protein
MRFTGEGRMRATAFVRRLYQEYEKNGVADAAAALSYYFVFALFPFLFFLTTLTAYLPPVRTAVTTMLDRARAIVPQQAMGLIDTHVRELVMNQRPRLLTVGIAVTLYLTSRGVDASRKALNQAYDVEETRPFWRTGMTIGGALLLLIGVTALVAGGDAGLWLAGRLHVARDYVVLGRWLSWPITAGAVMTLSALSYHLLPNVGPRKFRLVTPGSVLGTVTWLGATWGFTQYVAHFGRYNITYGSIGGVIVLMTWFYITGFLFLMGGEVNSIVESHQRARRDRELV